MTSVLDIFKERGFLDQITDEEGLGKALKGPTTCYIGFDPTASSLHVGSLVPIMALAHMQRCGHRPIALMGGGTALIGDPSGKTEMRKLLTHQEIQENGLGLKAQLSRYLDFSEDRAVMQNNADWLIPLNYIEFLRDIGRHFSVNRMLASESVKQRLVTGLSFIEFNYMCLQAYDFYHLFGYENCLLQMGGRDQWGNIVAGIDLIRRMTGQEAYGLTFPLITTASGAKMGKTAKGAIWLEKERTSAYDFYQYWINTDDQDVERFLKLFTFLPLENIAVLCRGEGAELRQAKEVLAWEATALCHGKEAADQVKSASRAIFWGDTGDTESLPTWEKPWEDLKKLAAFELFALAGLTKSRYEARRLIQQGGAYINGERVSSFDTPIQERYVINHEIILRAGKKRYLKIKIY
jgi:tyrosyl-tRNA synthetase